MRSTLICMLLIIVSPLCAKRYGGSSTGRTHTGSGPHYPSSTGYSGNSHPVHNYPHSSGLSGNNHQSTNYVEKTRSTGVSNNYHSGSHTHKTEVHHHYHYSPPQHVSYGAGQYPVYHERPPVYVYEYRNSGSRFDNLLTGLALYNLGRMSSNNHNNYNYNNREYKSRPDEVCKLRISKSNGEYEETRIDCMLMSSFIWEVEGDHNKVVTTNTKTTTVNVVQNTTAITKVQNTTIINALEVKGPSIQVSPGTQCFMIRIQRDVSVLNKKVECGLLQEYARSSMRYSGGTCIIPASVLYITVLMKYLIK